MRMPSSKKIVVYGATGAIGTNLIEIMSKNHSDWTILAASRSGGASSYLASLKLPNVHLVKGDIEVIEDARKLTQDVDMVFSCLGFPQYEVKYWAAHWPVVVKNLLEVTSTSRPLIFCDNLYAYGPGTKINSSSPTVSPSLTSKKGIRATIRELFAERMKSAPKSISVVGGADFFGPRLEGKTFLGDPFIGNIIHGKNPMAFCSADKIHDFCYYKDFANALYVAAINPDKAYGKFWICPHTVHNKTLRDLSNVIQDILGLEGKDRLGVQVLPSFLISFMALFMGFMKEMKEMKGFWANDYVVDDSEFVKTFGVEPTPLDVALRETIAYYQNKRKEDK
jgi:nucleoside-diphosphate-sugar epimerase